MSKREQDRTSKEGPAVDKPKQMSLVAGSLLSSKKDPPQIWSASNDPGKSKMDASSSSASIGKPLRGSDSKPKSQSQEWQNDNTQSAGIVVKKLQVQQASANRCEVTVPKF